MLNNTDCRRSGNVSSDAEGKGTRERLTDLHLCSMDSTKSKPATVRPSIPLLVKQESGGALTAIRSMFMVLRESHCVGTCVVAWLASLPQEAP